MKKRKAEKRLQKRIELYLAQGLATREEYKKPGSYNK